MWQEPFPDDDRELISRCRKGDSLAFEELVKKYQQTVFNLAYHYLGYRSEVDDVAQKIFTKVYFSLSKFDEKRPFLPWLYRIAINQCYDELRHIRRQRTHTFSELSLEESNRIENLISQNDSAAILDEDREELRAVLDKVLNLLPDQQRLAVVLRDLEAIPYSQIAAILKCSEQAARLKVFRARTRLKDLLQRAGVGSAQQ